MRVATKRTSVVFMVLVGALIGAFLWRWPQYDLSQVHSSIRSLQRPFQRFSLVTFSDGGSISIEITDRNGNVLNLAISPPGERDRRHLFIAKHFNSSGAVELPFTHDTRLYMAELVDQYFVPSPTYRDEKKDALIVLRGAPQYYAVEYPRILARKVSGR
jgi:hypothetical protein